MLPSWLEYMQGEGGKGLELCGRTAVRHVDDGGGSGKRTLGNGERELGLLYIWKMA